MLLANQYFQDKCTNALGEVSTCKVHAMEEEAHKVNTMEEEPHIPLESLLRVHAFTLKVLILFKAF
jgi:hypothetical protein